MATKTAQIKITLPWLMILTLIFVTLKLLDKIDWSWLWVLSPLWLPYAIVAGLFAIIFVGYLLCEGVGEITKRLRKRNDRNKTV